MNKYSIGAIVLAISMMLTSAIPALAENKAPNKGKTTEIQRGNEDMKPFIVGTVSAINGNTITVSGHANGNKAISTTTYTVNATNAKITKNNETSSISNIIVGDVVAVQGAIAGTNVVATTIRDGVMGGPSIGFGKGRDNNDDKIGTSTKPMITGNGQPIVAGTISAISNSTISITNKSNVTYTVNATNAKILQGNKTIEFSTLKIGDAVIVQGTINGTSIVASSIIDQNKPVNSNKSFRVGFFGGMGQFFAHLFGF